MEGASKDLQKQSERSVLYEEQEGVTEGSTSSHP